MARITPPNLPTRLGHARGGPASHRVSGTAKETGPAAAERRSQTMSRPSPAVVTSWESLIWAMPAGGWRWGVWVALGFKFGSHRRCAGAQAWAEGEVGRRHHAPVMRPCCWNSRLGLLGFSRMLNLQAGRQAQGARIVPPKQSSYPCPQPLYASASCTAPAAPRTCESCRPPRR